MATLVRRLMAPALATALLAGVAGCNKSSTFPTPTLMTEEFSGALDVGGESFDTFTVEYPFTGTDVTVTVVSLTLAATGAPVTTIGVGFGSITGETCTRAASATQNAANVGQEYTTQNSLFVQGLYCVSVFDTGTLTGTSTYVVRVKHY